MQKKKVSFQGLKGAYSDLVCRKFYKDFDTLPCESFQQTLDAVTSGSADLALIPVENNIAGRVADMHFLLEKISLKIVAEHYHKIEHHLMMYRGIKVCVRHFVSSGDCVMSAICSVNLSKYFMPTGISG